MSLIKLVSCADGKESPLPSPCPPSVIALGLFDGVHIGHRALLKEAVKRAWELNATAAVFTFSEGSGIKEKVPRIYDDNTKMRLLHEAGIEFMYVADFSSVCSLSPEDFVCTVLFKRLSCKLAVSGFNFRFGKAACANADDLKRLSAQLGMGCSVIDEERVLGKAVSSTAIRELLTEGRVSEAARLLGRPYFISGTVEHGRGQGASWGFPTVNTPLRGNTPLKRGVYASLVYPDGKAYPALTNVGVCPSFGERELHAETTIMGFNGSLYGKRIDVHLIEYIREEKIFNSPAELKEQIGRDMERAERMEIKDGWKLD